MRVKICSHGVEKWGAYDIISTKLLLKTYYSLYGLNPNIEWLYGGYYVTKNLESTVDDLLNENIDVLGLGMYTWNYKFQMQLAEKIKKIKPDTILVLGGPELSVHHDIDGFQDKQKNFFQHNPFIDYVVYGDGEKPFQQIIDFESGLISDDNFVNIVKNNNGERFIFPYERLTDTKFFSTNPYLHNKDFFIKEIQKLENIGIPKWDQAWAVEYARGCMYSCSFCDWSQNLSKKVARKKANWQEEIDLFAELGVKMRITDANFGQWPEDIKIFDYAMSKYYPGSTFLFVNNNTPKLKKEVTAYMNIKTLKTYGAGHPVIRLKTSLQDIHEDILQNINRPSVSFKEIEDLIQRYKDNLNLNEYLNIAVECILGLPGQTFNHIKNILKELYRIGILNNFQLHDWYWLPNSPAAQDKNSQKFWGLETKFFYVFNNRGNLMPQFNTLEQAYSEIGNDKDQQENFHFSEKIYKTKHMTYIELRASQILAAKARMKILNVLDEFRNHYIHKRFSDPSQVGYVHRLQQAPMLTTDAYNEWIDNAAEQSLQIASDQFGLHQQLIEKHNYIIDCFWAEKEKKLARNYHEYYALQN